MARENDTRLRRRTREREEPGIENGKVRGRLRNGAWCLTWRQVAHTSRPYKRDWKRQETKAKRLSGRRRIAEETSEAKLGNGPESKLEDIESWRNLERDMVQQQEV